MATSPAPAQSSAIVHSLLDIVSSMATLEEPERGGMYSADRLAAAVPVWFHPLGEVGYLAILQQHWTNAVVGVRGPQSYSSHVASSTPSWAVVDPASRTTGTVLDIPSNLPGVRTVSGAVSRMDYLFTVGSCDGAPHVAYFRVTREGSIVLQSEEIVPVPGELVGVYLETQLLVCLVRNADGHLVQVSRPWYRIGDRATIDPGERWKYWGAKGWYPDIADMSAVADDSGEPISVAQAASLVKYQNKAVLAVDALIGDSMVATIYKSRIGWGWQRQRGVVDLGAAATYLNGGLLFQPQLPVDRTRMVNPSAQGFAYVSSIYGDAADEEWIDTRWGLYEV